MSADLASAIADVVASGNVDDVAVQDFQRQAMVICGSVSSGEAQRGGDGEVAAGGGAGPAAASQGMTIRDIKRMRRQAEHPAA